MSDIGNYRGQPPNKDVADLIRKIRRNHTIDELKKMWVRREDDVIFLRIGLAARGDKRDTGEIPPNAKAERMQLATLGYEMVTASSKLTEFVVAEY